MEIKPPPATLYKYFTRKNGTSILRDLEVKITPPAEFNDPFEFSPRYPTGHDETSLKRAREAFETTASTKYGVFCASVENNNPLLWAHYGDSHKGIAIGFNTSKWLKIASQFLPVNYSETKILISIGEKARDEQAIDIVKLAITKHILWDYEDEYRMLFALKSSTPRIINKKRLFFERIPTEIITDVILGACYPKRHERRIALILQDPKFSAVHFQRARLNNDEYKIDLEDIVRKRI